jgi:hypothetical protein
MRSFNTATICVAVLAMLGVMACKSKDESSGPETVELLSQAAAVGSYMVLVDKKGDRAFSLDVSAEEKKLASTLTETKIAANPFWTETRKGESNEALILSAGRQGVSEPTVLSAMTVEDSVNVREYKVGAPFDTLLQSEDGTYALLYFSHRSDDLLFSLNEIAIVDLSQPGIDPNASTDEEQDKDTTDEGVSLQSIDTSNGEISKIKISPEYTIGKQKRVLAVALSEARATIVDLTKPTREHTMIKLSDASGDLVVQPEQVEFNASRGEIYVRGKNSNDIFVLSLQAVSNDYEASVSQIPVGIEPTDMKVYGKTKLLVVSQGSQEVYIIDRAPSSSDDATTTGVYPEPVNITLDSEEARIALFDVDKKNAALLYKEGSRTITFLDLENAETQKESNLETRTLQEPVSGVKVFDLDKEDFALVTHSGSSMDIVDMKSHDVRTVRINSSLKNAVYDTDNPRLWIVPPEQNFVSYVDLNTGATNNNAVVLDDPIKLFVVVSDATKVVAVHENDVCNSKSDDSNENENSSTAKTDKSSETKDDCSDEPISVSILDADTPSRGTMVQFSAFINEQTETSSQK